MRRIRRVCHRFEEVSKLIRKCDRTQTGDTCFLGAFETIIMNRKITAQASIVN